MNETKVNTTNRMMLLLIGGIPVIIVLAATWLWFFVARGDLDLVGMLGTANRGTLVQPPRQLGEQTLLDASGAPVEWSTLEPRWSMVVPAAGGQCDSACEEALYLTRQIHVAMGKNFNRLRRFYISDFSAQQTQLTVSELTDGHPTPDNFTQYLTTEHQGLESFILPVDEYVALFPEQAANDSTWYLVDPAGWIMMSYNSDVTYKEVMSDLKFLLKNSGG